MNLHQPTNHDRAGWGRAALKAWREACQDVPADENAGDCLADLLHMIAEDGGDPERECERALGHYQTECAEETT